MRFKVGEKVKFITDSGRKLKSGENIPSYVGESNIAQKFIIHGNTILGSKYDEESATIIGISNGYYAVRFFDCNKNYVQLGFKEEYLKSAKINWREKLE